MLLLLFLLSTAPAIAQPPPPFGFGADLSAVNEMEDCGAVYRERGIPRDPFALLAQHGMTWVRVRLWHDPTWTDYSTLPDAARTLERAQGVGAHTLLALHYSDDWADPGHQQIPAAWQGLGDAALADAVHAYTTDVLRTPHTDGLTPDMVQIGNEINSGLLKPDATAPIDWARTAALVNAGIDAVRGFSTATGVPVRVMLHIAGPENAAWWFREAGRAGITDYDVAGLSYYPQWHALDIPGVGAAVAALRAQTRRDVMVVETGYPWTTAYADSAGNLLSVGLPGYPLSIWGQRAFFTDLAAALRDAGALGLIAWEPGWVSTGCSTRWGQGSHWENAAFFDFRRGGEVLPVVQALRP